jgi:hypothetical protein
MDSNIDVDKIIKHWVKTSDEHSDWLDKVTYFNINARYDDYKNDFYKKCTPEFTEYWINKITTLRTWISQKL